jgi:sulfate permease, SulP family
MHRYRQVMVALARTNADAGPLAHAALAAKLGTAERVHLVHVMPSSADAASTLDHDGIRTALQSHAPSYFRNVPDTVEVDCEVLHGPLLDQLLAYIAERDIDLLLMGAGLDPARRRTLARRLAMKAPCSVWLVPPGSSGRLRRILVPIDFSANAADALRVATSLASLGGLVECLTLHVYFNEAVIAYEGYHQLLRGREREAYEKFIAPINCQGVSVEPLFEEGANVAHAIGRVAEQQGVDAIVMATRGRSRSAAILLGSVTEEMILSTHVPLLAVKHFGARMSVLQALLDRRFWHKGSVHTD